MLRVFVCQKKDCATSVFDDIKSRLHELQRIWKPVGLVLFIFSSLGAVMEFQRRTGPFIYVGLVLSALAFAILFTIPIKSIRLSAARSVAFLVDLAFSACSPLLSLTPFSEAMI
jgi:hypothetical protein